MKEPRKLKDGTSQQTLNRDAIVAAALDLVRRDGIESLSMRRVAGALGSGAMSLYRHVKNREDLLTGVLDKIALEMIPPPAATDPKVEIEQLMIMFHQAFRADPWLVKVLLLDGIASRHILPLSERLFTALALLECRDEEALAVFGLLLHYTFGESLAFENARKREPSTAKFRQEAEGTFPAAHRALTIEENWDYSEYRQNLRRILSTLKS